MIDTFEKVVIILCFIVSISSYLLFVLNVPDGYEWVTYGVDALLFLILTRKIADICER